MTFAATEGLSQSLHFSLTENSLTPFQGQPRVEL
jgi:hypothetical protein